MGPWLRFPAAALVALLTAAPGAGEFWDRPISHQGPPPDWAIGNPPVADPESGACGLCHIPQHQAWQGSFHARALSPGVLGQLDALSGPNMADCLSCHAPRAEVADRWRDLGAGAADQLAGVDCATCHVRAQLRLGPRDLAITPHGAVQSLPLFRQAEFCAPCHQFDATGLSVNGKPLENTLEEWRASRYARAGTTCQTCHMPDGRHDFRGIHDPEMTRLGLGVDARRTAEGLAVRVGNRGAGHALPTYVTPRILIDLVGAAGTPRHRHVVARTMHWSLETGWEELADSRLLPDQWIDLALPLPAGQAGTVRVRVEPDYDYRERIYPTLLDLWADTLSADARRLLLQAWETAGTSPYTLYHFVCPDWTGQDQPCRMLP